MANHLSQLCEQDVPRWLFARLARTASTERAETVDELLEPPDEFTVELPVLELGPLSLYRVHLQTYGAVYFDTEPTHRFNAPRSEYGVLYASESPEGAFAETFLRRLRRPPQLSEGELRTRAMSELRWERLRVADFTSARIAGLGLDARISSGDCYALAQRWSRWVHAHPVGVDGICYLARHAPSLRSVALFDRVATPSSCTSLIDSFMPEPGQVSASAKHLMDMFDVAIV